MSEELAERLCALIERIDFDKVDAMLEHIERDREWGAINIPRVDTEGRLFGFVRFTRGDLECNRLALKELAVLSRDIPLTE